MKRISGSAGAFVPIECTNPAKNKWRIRWDRQPEDDNFITYMEEEFDHRPTIEETKSVILNWYNDQINQKIISGFRWKDIPVWLSSENQFNYKAAYDLAIQTQGESLPVKFKFGTDEEPVYHEFSNLQEFSDFFMKSIAFVNQTLNDGWQEKDAVGWNLYEIEI